MKSLYLSSVFNAFFLVLSLPVDGHSNEIFNQKTVAHTMNHYTPSSLDTQISALEALLSNLQQKTTLADKLSYLTALPEVVQGLNSYPFLKTFSLECPIQSQYVIQSVLAINQGEVVFGGFDACDQPKDKLNFLVKRLLEVEKFYDSIGGIVGYHLTLLKLLASNTKDGKTYHYDHPVGLDISQDAFGSRQAVRWGIEALRHLGMICPLGGAGDRLDLHDEKTGEPLPAAQLTFGGFTLLEGIVRDLQGWEFLYYKLFGKQLMTPLALMTSHEKQNDQRIRLLCEAREHFGRSLDSFDFFLQPLVPMVTAEGDWAMSGPLQPMFKPGGHGALWKTALDSGVFEWFDKWQRKKVVIRQINNPMAATDNGLLALAGIGDHQNKSFGFASCQRLLKSPEGMNVLKGVQLPNGDYEYGITNIEYTDFARYGINDSPAELGSSYSVFPCNTNILFADLNAIQKAIKICPLPGMLVNMKSKFTCWSSTGSVCKSAGRLESTMQNIADYMTDRVSHKLTEAELTDLQTFLIYNERRKTISVVKKSYVPGEVLNGTPEGCFFEHTENYRDLLTNYCGMTLPPEQDESDYLSNGPNFTASFHPALGILYSVISQKIRHGCVSKGADWIIEASEVHIEHIDLAGSLVIEADAVMGKKDVRGVTIYDSDSCGKCTLLNVKIRNEGNGGRRWQDSPTAISGESVHIVLHGNAEFFAEDVEFIGDVHFDVPDGHRLVVYRQGGEMAWYFEKIQHASWRWDYTFDNEDQICLEKVKVVY